MRAMIVILLLVACGPSSSELRTIKTTVYSDRGDAAQLLALADVDDGHLTFETQPKFYSPEGDLQSEGAGGYTHVDHHSVQVSFIVSVQETADHQYVFTVAPRTWQYLAGSPQMRELAPEDPNLPPFVHGRADALAVAIHDRAKGFAIASQ